MRRFQCSCGQRVFFENLQCTHCKRQLGFDPLRFNLVTLQPAGEQQHVDASGYRYRFCKNHDDYRVCNWVLSADSGKTYCYACERNEVVPNLSADRNVILWGRLEQAKRRLLYTLLALRLPVDGIDSVPSMSFRFLEDQRANPLVSEEFVTTGHHGGTITINLSEADDSARHAVREDMWERYRTVLGHLRHESGHYYFDPAIGDDREGFRKLFGDERADYETALAAYHQRRISGSDWWLDYISQYASAHPLEDWAESWAHYLHIVDTLETAHEWGLVPGGSALGSEGWLRIWRDLSVAMNELNRSMGTDDSYPFVLSPPVIDKLEFIHRRVERLAGTKVA